MKNLLLIIALACAAAAPAAAAATSAVTEVGVGVIVGDPIGGTAKLWLGPDYAVDLGIGYSGSTVLWGDVLYHAWNLFPPIDEGKLGLYFGAGPRIETGDDTEFGVRTLAGVSWRLSRQPMEFFAEMGPVFRLTQGGGVGIDGGVGVRLYLGSVAKR
jgi:hypothetical protein